MVCTARCVWASGNRSGAKERSREESAEEIAKKFRELRGNLKRRYTREGSQRLPFNDGITSAADATAGAGRDGRQEETRAGGRESETAVSELHGAGSRHGAAERDDGFAGTHGSFDERDRSKGRKRA